MLIQRTFPFIMLVITTALTYLFIKRMEKTHKIPNFKKMPQIDALDEAIGRCVETNRPAHYQPFGSLVGGANITAAPSFITSLSILSRVAGSCVKKGAHLIVTTENPETIPLTEEIIETAYVKAGYPEEKPDLRFMTTQQYAAAMGVIGILEREKVAASFLFGSFGGNILIIGESAHNAGAMVISGTEIHYQIPVMVVTSDYCFIGEEMFAAGALISEDPNQLGAIVGEDFAKIILIIILALGAIVYNLGFNIVNWLTKLQVI